MYVTDRSCLVPDTDLDEMDQEECLHRQPSCLFPSSVLLVVDVSWLAGVLFCWTDAHDSCHHRSRVRLPDIDWPDTGLVSMTSHSLRGFLAILDR